jgi:hypothetical protein
MMITIHHGSETGLNTGKKRGSSSSSSSSGSLAYKGAETMIQQQRFHAQKEQGMEGARSREDDRSRGQKWELLIGWNRSID